MSKATIVIVGADKGGTGKTTVTRALLDFLDAHRVVYRAFDTESPAGDLVRFATKAKVIDISKVQSQMEVFDGANASVVTVVDLRAGMLSETIKALEEACLLEDVRAGDMNLVLLHVLGPTISSLGEITSVVERIGGGARHLLVKNHINDTTFFEWDAAGSPLRSMNDVTINVPQLVEIACEAVQKVGGTFVDFTKNATQSRLLRGRVKTWVEAVWVEFSRVGILSPAPAGVPADVEAPHA
jgi:hypothetical protein